MWSFLDIGVFRSRPCESHGQCRWLPRGASLSHARDLLPWSHRGIWAAPDGSAELGEMPQCLLDLHGIWVKSSFSSEGWSLELSQVLVEHFFNLPPTPKPPSRSPAPATLCLPQLWSSELSPYTKRTGNWLGFVASWQQNCLLLCSSGGKKPLPPFSLLQQSVSFLFVKN